MFGARLQTIQAKIIAVVLGAALVTALCSAFFVDQMRRNIEAQIVKDQSAIAATYAGLVDENIKGARSVSDGFNSDPIMRTPLHTELFQQGVKGIPDGADPDRRAAAARLRAAAPAISTIVVAAANGDLYLTDPPESQKTFPIANLSGREYFQNAVKSGKPTWADILISTTGPVATLATPIKDEQGTLQAVVMATLQLSSMADTANLVDLGDDDAVMLFDTKGVPIVHQYGDAIAPGKPL